MRNKEHTFLSTYIAWLLGLTWTKVQRRITRVFMFSAEERIYRIAPVNATELPGCMEISRDRWEDLNQFIPSEPGHSRSACLNEWRHRLDNGEHVYTRIENGRLATYGWVVERQKTALLGWTHQTLELPDNCAVLYDFYTIPEYRNSDFYQLLLMHAVQDAGSFPGTRWIYLGVRADDKVPRWWVERIGFEYCESYFYKRVLWRAKKWRAKAP